MSWLSPEFPECSEDIPCSKSPQRCLLCLQVVSWVWDVKNTIRSQSSHFITILRMVSSVVSLLRACTTPLTEWEAGPTCYSTRKKHFFSHWWIQSIWKLKRENNWETCYPKQKVVCCAEDFMEEWRTLRGADSLQRSVSESGHERALGSMEPRKHFIFIPFQYILSFKWDLKA